MSGVVGRYVIAREGNILRVDFGREPDPPAPNFPGARGLRPRARDDKADAGAAQNRARVLAF